MGEDGDLGAGDGGGDGLAEAGDPGLRLGHGQGGSEFQKHFHEDLGAGAAAAHLVESFVVVEVADELVKDLELGGFLKGRIHQVVDGGGSDGVGGVEHEADPEEGGEGIEVEAPGLGAEKQLQDQGGGHEGVEAGLGKPEAGLGFDDRAVLLAEEPAVAGPNGKTDGRIRGKDEKARQGATGRNGMMEVADHHGEKKQGATHHDEADGEADEVLQLADAVAEPVAGGFSEGEDGQVGGEHGEKVGAFLKKVAEDGERVRVPGGSGHEEDVGGAEAEGDEEVFFARAGSGGGDHGRGWNGKLRWG